MYGMKKTTVYLTDELKAGVEKIAVAEGRPEAEIIRDAIAKAVEDLRPPEPRVLHGMTLGDPTIAERVDELLDGFGE